MPPWATRENAPAIGLAVAVGAALVATGIADCAAAVAAGWDRNPRVFGPSAPTAPSQSWLGLAVAILGPAGLGLVVGRRGGSPRVAAAVAAGALAGAAVVSALVQPALFPTAYYYFIPPLGSVAYYVAPLGVILSAFWWIAAALLAAVLASRARERRASGAS